jgi:hypothetical protein
MDKRTIEFDTFGDIVLEKGDLKISQNIGAIVQILSDYFKTNYGDYLFHPEHGANYGSFIGRPVDKALVSEIVSKVSLDIKKLDILPENSYKVHGLADGNTIQIRVMIMEVDDYTIYLNIDTIKGISIGY